MKQFAPRFPRTPPHVTYKVAYQLHIRVAVNHHSRVTCACQQASEPYNSAIWSESETTLCLHVREYSSIKILKMCVLQIAHIIQKQQAPEKIGCGSLDALIALIFSFG